MVQVIPQLGSLSSQLGRGLGQGLSEQVPKEIDRYRLKSGLQNIQKNPGATPLDRLIQLYGTPGVNPEMAQQIEPYLRNAAARSGQPSGSQPSPQSTSQAGAAPKALEEGKFDISNLNLRKGTEEALRQRGFELVDQNPNLYPTVEAGYQQAEKEYSRQEDNIKKATDTFNDILATKIQKGAEESYGDVLGNLQNDFRLKAIADVTNGKSTALDAANKYAEQAKNFAMANQQLKTIGNESWLDTKPSLNLDRINKIRDKFAEQGQLESFKDELIATNDLTEPYANYLAFPPSKNKELSKAIKEIPVEKGILSKIGYNLGQLYTSGNKSEKAMKNLDSFVEKFAKAITPIDSILGTAVALQGKKLDPTEFVNKIDRMYREGNINLSERQQRELSEKRTFHPNLGDIYLYEFSGLGKEFGE